MCGEKTMCTNYLPSYELLGCLNLIASKAGSYFLLYYKESTLLKLFYCKNPAMQEITCFQFHFVTALASVEMSLIAYKHALKVSVQLFFVWRVQCNIFLKSNNNLSLFDKILLSMHCTYIPISVENYSIFFCYCPSSNKQNSWKRTIVSAVKCWILFTLNFALILVGFITLPVTATDPPSFLIQGDDTLQVEVKMNLGSNIEGGESLDVST